MKPRAPVRPAPLPEDVPKLFYRRGQTWPTAIAWLGFKSFWGHLWHLVASVIATEDIDSRDWMQPDSPLESTRRIARALGAPNEDATTLSEALDGDVWIDFVADTGDDFAVSKAVAALIANEYEVDDPDRPGERLILPRGHVLVFGGDTAYPVATDMEIHNRVIVPFNQVLHEVDDDTPRVLLGVPGNHDWYAGLDGFGRMFRARRTKLDRSAEPKRAVDRAGQIGHFIEWVEAFRVGTYVVKRTALVLAGYTPVQSASYWTLNVAPNLDLWGIDRQLRLVDFQQRAYFTEQRSADRALVLCVADPPYAFLEPNAAGQATLEALDLQIERDKLLVLTGDTHHYCRQKFGEGMQVIAGGGGAFLHPQCIARGGKPSPEAEFPGPKTTLVLALQVPWKIVHGRSGFLVHTAVALAYAPLYGTHWATGRYSLTGSILTALVAMIICIFLAGFRKSRFRIGALSLVAGAAIGFLPLVASRVLPFAHAKLVALTWLDFAISVYLGTLIIGTYLMLLTILGLEQHQAFSALAHPGYKHFVRLRFAKDGSRTDAWVLGRVDPLADSDPIVLVDRFTWRNPVRTKAAIEARERASAARASGT